MSRCMPSWQRAASIARPRGSGRDVVAEEVGDEALLREAEAAARAVDGVVPSRRHASPPGAAPRVVLVVLHHERHVLAEREDLLRDTPGVGHAANAVVPSRSSATVAA